MVKIKHIIIKNFIMIKMLDVEITSNTILVQSGGYKTTILGKTTFLNAIRWCMLENFKFCRGLNNLPLNFKQGETSVEITIENNNKILVLKRCFFNNNFSYFVNENQVSLDEYKKNIVSISYYDYNYLLKNSFMEIEDMSLDKLNEIAKELTIPKYNTVYLKFNKIKKLELYNKKDNSLYLDGMYSEGEKVLLIFFTFLVMQKYKNENSIVLIDGCVNHIDSASVPIIMDNITKFFYQVFVVDYKAISEVLNPDTYNLIYLTEKEVQEV